MMSKLQVRNSFLLFVAAFIWGTAFVAQSVGMEYIEPFTFSTLRSFIGSAFLIPCIGILGKWKGKKAEQTEADKKELLKGGIVCGVVIFAAASLQQVAMLYTLYRDCTDHWRSIWEKTRKETGCCSGIGCCGAILALYESRQFQPGIWGHTAVV